LPSASMTSLAGRHGKSTGHDLLSGRVPEMLGEVRPDRRSQHRVG
jgi:hypothetical protein